MFRDFKWKKYNYFTNANPAKQRKHQVNCWGRCHSCEKKKSYCS